MTTTLPTATAGPFRVLAIEDDLSIARLLQVNLQKAQMQFRHAGCGDLGLKVMEEFQPHLVLLDLNLPDISGYEVCSRIRQKSHVPVIMMTARIEPQDQMRGLGCGADDYVTKPFDLPLLMARVATHLRRAHRYSVTEASPSAAPAPPRMAVSQAASQAHGPWSKCGRCGYMGPNQKFEELAERFQLKRVCPNCLGVMPPVRQ